MPKKITHPVLRHLWEGLLVLAGSCVYALSVNMFTAPNKIAPGGASGLATALNFVTGFPIGTAILIINIPLFILGVRMLGWRFLIKTMVATVLLSIAVDVFAFVPAFAEDTLLAAIYGGALSGLGLALIFMVGATTGGSDLAGRMLQEKIPHMSMGRLILIIDAVVVVIAAAVFRDAQSMFYSAITIFISSTVIDKILNGLDFAKALYIITDKSEQVAAEINHRLGRGATLMPGKGSYTGADRTVMLCVVKRNEVTEVKRLVIEQDSHAFIILTDASEVMGEGFKQYPPERGRGKKSNGG